jgi:uncharacterized protein (DUF433 family)
VYKQKEMQAVTWQDLLTPDPRVCGGEICAKGPRVPVTVILDSLAEGANREEILRSYPSLKPDHISAALAYAAELAREETLLPLQAQ